jgi:hypothetical protein
MAANRTGATVSAVPRGAAFSIRSATTAAAAQCVTHDISADSGNRGSSASTTAAAVNPAVSAVGADVEFDINDCSRRHSQNLRYDLAVSAVSP